MSSKLQKIKEAAELFVIGLQYTVLSLMYVCLVVATSLIFIAAPVGLVLGLIFQNETFTKTAMVVSVAVATLIAIGHFVKEELNFD